jgi:hypothetical protein
LMSLSCLHYFSFKSPCCIQGHLSLTPIALKESILEREDTPALHQVLDLFIFPSIRFLHLSPSAALLSIILPF